MLQAYDKCTYKHVTIACEDVEYNIVGSDKRHTIDRNTTEIIKDASFD